MALSSNFCMFFFASLGKKEHAKVNPHVLAYVLVRKKLGFSFRQEGWERRS
jgi:hypothetical protein